MKKFSGAMAVLIIIVCVIVVASIPAAKKLAKFSRLIDTPPVKVVAHDQHIVLFAMGDSGSGFTWQQDVADAMEERCNTHKPDALLLLGDLIYPDGTETLADPRWHRLIFDMYGGECLRDVPIFPALGNHDYKGNPMIWKEAHSINPRWWFPHRHYQVLFEGLLSVYAIDTMSPAFIHTAVPALGDRLTPWSIAFGHHPVKSESERGGRHKGGGLGGILTAWAICDHVDSYLSGHSHHLEHLDIDNCGADQFISGAGGAALYPIRENPQYHFGAVEYGFLEIEVEPKTMAFRFISADNSIIYQHHKRK